MNFATKNIKRRTMIFHSNWYDIVQGLKKDEQYEALTAIIYYGLNGLRPKNCSDAIHAVLDYTQETIEKDYNRFVEYIKARNAG